MKKKLSSQVAEEIKINIYSGAYPLHSAIPNERELSEIFNVSRSPVREAINELVNEGLLEVRRGVGTFVIATHKSAKDEEINDDTHVLANQEIKTLIRTTLVMRKKIEMQAAYLAAKNITDDEVKDLELKLFDTISEIRKLKLNQENNFFEADFNFHMAVVKYSHDEFINDLLKDVKELIKIHQYYSLKFTTPIDEVVSYHTAIFEQILLRNPEEARKAMDEHLSRVKYLITSK